LQAYLREVTLRVIRDEVFADASEAQEVPEALPPLSPSSLEHDPVVSSPLHAIP
jgi:hypothetical protein